MRLLQSIRLHATMLFVLAIGFQTAVTLEAAQTAAPVPAIQWWSPGKVPLGQTTFTIYGSNFASNAVVKLQGMPLPTTYRSSTELKAISNVTMSGSSNVTVTNPGPMEVTSAPRLVEFGQGIVVTITPNPATVAPGATQQFTANVAGASNTQVWWYVNGGSANGTISSNGLYRAPAAAPAASVTIRAVSAANSERQATASVTVAGASATAAGTVTIPTVLVSIGISPTSAALVVGGTQQFTANVSGSSNTAATWQVNNIAGGNSTWGTIDGSGLYTAPPTIPAGAITVTAVSQADPTKKASAGINIIDPTAITIGRFLNQASFGPTPQLTAHVKQVGISAWIDEQFNTPESTFPNGAATTMNEMMDQYYLHFMTGQDQLRQRVIHSLTEVIVVSRNKNYYPDMLIPWLQILSKNAFGNYKDLLKEITLDASMGNFLDMVNSTKPGVYGGANENYARELMQLFCIGLYELNPDGTQKLDANNKPISTYNQTDVRQLALALTGWTFNRVGNPPTYPNSNYYPGPMVAIPNYHDTSSKTFLGHTIPAGQTNQKDIDDVIEIVFNHPNVGPFVATRLIRGLTDSNPSPQYVARVAAAFHDNGQGVRGDMKAVIRAILLDPEARSDNPPDNFGKLRSPMLHHIALFRALGGAITAPSQIAYVYDSMGESVLNAPSVFGHYSPLYRVPGQTPPLLGPEFQIHGAGELINRGNFLWNFMNYYQSGIWDLQWLFNLGGDHNACINAVDNLLLFGRMSPGLRQTLQTALQAQAAAGGDAKMRALTALYLTAMSSEYVVMN